MNFEQRFRQLDRLLDEHAWLWRPQPFKHLRPDWCDRLPGLCTQLLALSDEELESLTSDREALVALLASHVPPLEALLPLSRLPRCARAAKEAPGPHFATGIPGRKWQQIDAFSLAMDEVRGPLLEWCGGKGHLGRLLAYHWGKPVLTLDRDEQLCDAGLVMAERAGVAQRFYRGDALSDDADEVLAQRHAVALHACGELHRSLIRRTVKLALPAVDIAPCCYHLHGEEEYVALTPAARLRLSRDDRRLAVTETVTAVGREVRQRDREMAWKLGYDLLRRELSGESGYRPIKPIDKQWLKLDFPAFSRQLARRDGVVLNGVIDWREYEARGWQRQRETMRLSLVRHAFRRAIELWLVTDMAGFLSAHGYHVTVGTFCERELTPRNILLSARRLKVG